jgi:hypothetical protein
MGLREQVKAWSWKPSDICCGGWNGRQGWPRETRQRRPGWKACGGDRQPDRDALRQLRVAASGT